MTDQELIDELRKYVHNFSKYPFDPGTASLAAYRLEHLLALVEEDNKKKKPTRFFREVWDDMVEALKALKNIFKR